MRTLIHCITTDLTQYNVIISVLAKTLFPQRTLKEVFDKWCWEENIPQTDKKAWGQQQLCRIHPKHPMRKPQNGPTVCVHYSHIHIPGNKTVLGRNFKQRILIPSLEQHNQGLEGRWEIPRCNVATSPLPLEGDWRQSKHTGKWRTVSRKCQVSPSIWRGF